MRLIAVEMRRALHRRLVRVMIVLAVTACAVTGVVEFFASAGLDLVAVRRAGQHDPALMADWWIAGTGESVLAIGALMLVIGALICGASVAGAEWRAGTVTTVLTWEPRRPRLHLARLVAAGALASAIAFALEVLLLAVLVPSVVAHGSTAGVDAAWLVGLLAAMARIALLTGLAAVVGFSLATLGRNTAAAIVVGWVWFAIAESALRSWKPGLGRFLVGENSTVVLSWAELTRQPSSTPPAALLLVLLYCAALSAAVTLVFARRDVNA